MTATGHAPNEETIVERALLHPDAVTEERAAAERRRRIDGDDRDTVALLAIRAREAIDERALPSARWTGDADDPRMARLRIELAEDVRGFRFVVLDDGEDSRERAFIPVARARE